MTEFKQIYKTRSEAFSLFIKPGGYPVKKSQFYDDCAERGMVQQDKSLSLSDLLSYVREKFEIDPGNNRSTRDDELSKEKQKLEVDKLRLEVEERQLKNRKEDRSWIHRDVVFEREGALVGQILNETRYRFGRAVDSIIHVANGDRERAPEIKKLLEETVFDSFRSLYDKGEVDMTFLDDEVEE